MIKIWVETREKLIKEDKRWRPLASTHHKGNNTIPKCETRHVSLFLSLFVTRGKDQISEDKGNEAVESCCMVNNTYTHTQKGWNFSLCLACFTQGAN